MINNNGDANNLSKNKSHFFVARKHQVHVQMNKQIMPMKELVYQETEFMRSVISSKLLKFTKTEGTSTNIFYLSLKIYSLTYSAYKQNNIYTGYKSSRYKRKHNPAISNTQNYDFNVVVGSLKLVQIVVYRGASGSNLF